MWTMHPLHAAALALIAKASATSFLTHSKYLSNTEDPGWYEANIPFLDIPDQQIQDVFYYRWHAYREHMVYTGPQYGYLLNEFLTAPSYGAPYGGVVAAAGHHIREGRWLRDQRYVKDDISFWLAGPGIAPKAIDDGLNQGTSDWAHQYSFWAASSVWQHYLVTGDTDFVVNHLDNAVRQYRGWDKNFNANLGLYWQVPVFDASEFTAASYETSPNDPYHGGAGYRPTLNGYQYGDARAIANIAALKGDSALASEYNQRADALQAATLKYLWDANAQFFKHRARDNNPSGALLGTREIMGYIPWMFNMQGGNATAFSQLKDSQGFAANYGPTTTERRSKWFMLDATKGCCRWDGPSWPFATAQTLTAAENLLHDYPAQSVFTADDYVTLLKKYAATQYRNGQPYVAEAHHPDDNSSDDGWLYDSNNWSEDYNHSTFVENVIAGLMGIRGQSNNTLIVRPLAKSWDWFALENIAYHGHLVTVIWDKTGAHYNQGKGLRVWVDDKLVANSDTLTALTVQVGTTILQTPDTRVNIAANTQRLPRGTKPFASYTSPYDDAWRVVDGFIYRTGVPQNSRWTSYQSPNAQDWIGLDFQRQQAVSDVRLFFYIDSDGVKAPKSWELQYCASVPCNWARVPGQTISSSSSTSNAETKITFPAILAAQLRVVGTNVGGGVGWGLSEFQVWSAAVFQFRNENSGKLLGVDHMLTTNSANVQQYEDNGSRDHLWQLVKAPGGWYKIKNVNSGLLLAVNQASTANSAQIQQYEDNGTADHLWRLEDPGNNGKFLVRNKNSGKVMGVDGMSMDNSANVVQFDDNGTADHLWTMFAAVPLN